MAPMDPSRSKSDMDIILERIQGIKLEDVEEMRENVTKMERIDAKYGSYEELAVLFLRTCTKQNIPFLLSLLQKISNIEGMRAEYGRTLVHIAAKENPEAIVSLIKMGCGVDTRDWVFFNTALHVSCIFGNMKSIFYLIQAGAGINLLNGTNETPLDIYLSLCRSNMGKKTERTRIAIAHTFSRMGFRLTPKHRCLRRQTFREKIFHTFNKAKKCNSVFSLQHICRLRVRDLLPPESLQASVVCLEIPTDLHDYLLYRPLVLDRHVICPHISKELTSQHLFEDVKS